MALPCTPYPYDGSCVVKEVCCRSSSRRGRVVPWQVRADGVVEVSEGLPGEQLGGVREPVAQGDHSNRTKQKLLPIKHSVKLATRKLTKTGKTTKRTYKAQREAKPQEN